MSCGRSSKCGCSKCSGSTSRCRRPNPCSCPRCRPACGPPSCGPPCGPYPPSCGPPYSPYPPIIGPIGATGPAGPSEIGGDPINVIGATGGDILIFDGDDWVNEQPPFTNGFIQFGSVTEITGDVGIYYVGFGTNQGILPTLGPLPQSLILPSHSGVLKNIHIELNNVPVQPLAYRLLISDDQAPRVFTEVALPGVIETPNDRGVQPAVGSYDYAFNGGERLSLELTFADAPSMFVNALVEYELD